MQVEQDGLLCNFSKVVADKGFANARQEKIEAYIYELR
jgi:hypothetical protein